MLILKAVHLIGVLSWFVGLQYLPRLFAYHAKCRTPEAAALFSEMERKLLLFVMSPAALLALSTGGGLWAVFGVSGYWLHAKLAAVAVMVAAHCWYFIAYRKLLLGQSRHSSRFFHIAAEVPNLAMIAAVCLAVLKPL